MLRARPWAKARATTKAEAEPIAKAEVAPQAKEKANPRTKAKSNAAPCPTRTTPTPRRDPIRSNSPDRQVRFSPEVPAPTLTPTPSPNPNSYEIEDLHEPCVDPCP